MPDELPPLVFDGFETPRYTQVPDQVFDLLLPYLSEAELKVLLYIIRRTFGFKKDADAISRAQMVDGITRADGTRLDWGAGCSESSVKRGIAGLVEKGLIVRELRRSAAHGDEAPIYRLRLRGDRGPESTPTGGQNEPRRDVNLTLIRGPESTPQETVQNTADKRGSDPDLLAAIHTLCYQRRWPLPERTLLALAEQARTLARWQAASAGARSLAEVEAALEDGR